MSQKLWVKFCGFCQSSDVQDAYALGVQALGFNFYSKSPRYIEPKEAVRLTKHLPKQILKVGVFVNEPIDRVLEIKELCGLDMMQFHGDEDHHYLASFKNQKLIKVFRMATQDDLPELETYLKSCGQAPLILLDYKKKDLYGGTGTSLDWHLAAEANQLIQRLKKGRLILSGGLNPQNLIEALQIVDPYGVDLASGIERSPGKKDLGLMKEFMKQVGEFNESRC